MAIPLASYSFDESDNTILDHSGHGYDFSIAGTNAAHAVAGHTNLGLTKSGTGMIPLPAGLLTACQSDSRTIMFWSKGTGGTWYVQCYVSSIDSGSWGLLSLDNTNMFVQARNAGGLVSPRPSAPIGDINWHHWTATYDGNNVRLYKDAVLVSTSTLTAPLRTDADALQIMEWGNTDTTIDDLRIFDVDLTQPEIETFMNTPVVDDSAAGTSIYIWDGVEWNTTTKRFYNGSAWLDA